MRLSEAEIVEGFRDAGRQSCYIPFPTKLCYRVCGELFDHWRRWQDASGKGDPTPDFFSDKARMMFDVANVYDSEFERDDKPGSFVNHVLGDESKAEAELRRFATDLGIRNDVRIFRNVEKTGFDYDKEHTYDRYVANVVRVIRQHSDEIPTYRGNHLNCDKVGLFLCDMTEMYICVDNISSLSIESGLIPAWPHYPWCDVHFMTALRDSGFDFVVYYMPYKAHSNGIKPGSMPESVVLDFRHPRLCERLVDYPAYLMRSL